MSAPYHQYQNGLIERHVRTVNEGARAMMVRANSPDYDWYYAKSYFVYLRNHFHIPEGLECPPAEMWEGINEPLDPGGAFGCKVLAKILYKNRKSMKVSENRKSRKCVYLGIDETCKAYIVRPYDGKKTTRGVRYAKRVSFYDDYPYTHNEVPRPPSLIDTGNESLSEIDSDAESTSEESGKKSETDSDTDASSDEPDEIGSQGESDTISEIEKDIMDIDYKSSIDLEDKEKIDSTLDTSNDRMLIDDSDDESRLDIVESSSDEEPRSRLRNRNRIKYNEEKVDYSVGIDMQRAILRRREENLMSEICNNFINEEYNFVTEEYTEQNIYNQNIFINDRDELDALYRKHGREKTPKNYKQVLSSPYKKFWLSAINDEVDTLKKLGVFRLIKRKDVPKGTKILRLLTILKTKMRQFEDKIDKHKARVCADGSAEQVEPHSTFAPTVVYHSVLLILMLTCHYDLDMITIDIKNFFVRCDMGDDDVYVEQIEGFEDAQRSTHVYRLEKALYGTKKASRIAQQELTKALIKSGYKSLKSDPMVFMKSESEPYRMSIIAGWVDDLLCVGHRKYINDAIDSLKEKGFDITIDESPKAYTGIQIDRIRKKRWMKIHQTEYARQMMWDFGMTDCKPVRSPIIRNRIEEDLKETENRKNHIAEDSKRREYQKKCGALIWLVKTRPDLAFAVGVLCRNMQNPNDQDFVRLKRILQYIAHSISVGYIWEATGNESFTLEPQSSPITAHADSDLAGRVVDSRSTSGYVIRYSDTGCFLCVSKMQQRVALSTTQAELICACECAKTIEWLRGFLGEINILINGPTIMYQDNRGAIQLAKNPVCHFRTRHFRIAQHYLRELEKLRIIETISVRSEEMWGDLMNKPQPPVRHLELRKVIMGE